MNTIAGQYYVKALDQYPYDLNEAMENLNYALSYNNEHIGANYLMGKLHHEQLNQYNEAEEYFVVAMANDPNHINVCTDYISLLIQMNELDKANKLIAYAQKLKGINLSKIMSFKALILEHKRKFKKALKALLHAFDEDSVNIINEDIKRVKMKLKLVNKSKKKSTKKKEE